MAFPPLTTVLKKILKQPTAPFHEYFVRAEVEALLKDVPHVKLKRDKYGNLLATYKNGKKKSNPVWVMAAHMDHPGFVKTPGSKAKSADYEFLGGVTEKTRANGIKRGLMKPVKGTDMAVWNFPVTITKEKISATACDDLVNCATIIAVFHELARLNIQTTVHAVFTRAEEVGWLGAWHLGENWPFGKDAVFLSLETSRPVNGAVFGGGPVVRVGDRLSIFDSEAVAVLMRTASEQGIRVQRCLLDAGACEATAMQAQGIRSAGISVPLGNYHNTDLDGNLEPEYVMMDDVKALIRLLTALVATNHDGLGERTIRERVALRQTEYAAHFKAGTAAFKK
jgi:putative aminopeptidase FrvX